MARFRLARPAQNDLIAILETSAERWGSEGAQRYAVLLAAAMRQVASAANGPLTTERSELGRNVRSFHVRHARRSAKAGQVRRSVHVLYFRVDSEGIIEIIRVLHERMDPRQHLEEPEGWHFRPRLRQ